MSNIDFLPRRLDRAFDRLAFPEAAKALFAMQQGNPAYVNFWDDFVGDSAGTWPASANWGYPATAGTGTEVIAIGALENGALVMTTGANANDSAGQGVGLHWKGDNGIYFICRFKIDSVSSSKFEVGLAAAVAGDTGAVATKATPTFQATIGADCAVFVFDTADDGLITFVSNGGAVDGNADTIAAAADTYYIVEIVVQDNTASGYLNGNLIGSGNIEGGTLVTPWVYVETNTTATKTLTVDYIGCVGPRG